MSVTFSITTDDAGGGRQVVAVSGDVDLFTVPQLKERMAEAIESGRVLLAIDLSHTSFIDSSGLGALIGAHGRVRERGGRLVLFAVGDDVARALELTGLDQVLPVFGAREDALADLAAA